MTKFRKKPVVIEALKWEGNNLSEIQAFYKVSNILAGDQIIINTLGGGANLVSVGDWIIKGVAGEFYPCKSDIFEATYEAVE